MRALAVISLGIAETWADRLEDADRHLEQGVALARRIGRPYLELLGLAHGAQIASFRSYTVGAQRGRQAIELAQRHGWGEDHVRRRRLRGYSARVTVARGGWRRQSRGSSAPGRPSGPRPNPPSG